MAELAVAIVVGLAVAYVFYRVTERRHAEGQAKRDECLFLLGGLSQTLMAMDEQAIEALKVAGDLHADLKQAIVTATDRLHADNGVLHEDFERAVIYAPPPGGNNRRTVRLP